MKWSVALALLALAACGAPELHPSEQAAHSTEGVVVSDGWASPTPNGVFVSGGYLTITNHAATDDRLVAVTSPRAGRTEVHEMAMDGPVMQMRAIAALPVGAGQAVTLAPGGLHIMFLDVAQPFAVGETIPVQLTFEHAGVIEATLTVRAPGAPAAEAGHGGH